MDVGTVATVQDLRQLRGAPGQSVILQSYRTLGDGGGGIFTWESMRNPIDDGGTIFKFDVPAPVLELGCWKRMYTAPLNALWFGLDATGATANDASHADMLSSAAAVSAPGFYYPSGTYLFAQTIGPWPGGAHIFGSGLSPLAPNHVNDQGGTVFHFSGNGIGVELGHFPDEHDRNGSLFENIEILGINPNGEAEAPSINEIGLDILNDGEITVRNCRFGGFKFGISLDCAEVCKIDSCSFDGAPPAGMGYPSSDRSTDRGVGSAFAIRLGTWKSTAGGCNQHVISNCQFNNTFWGILHDGGANHRVVDCNFEGNIAILTEGNIQVLYENISGEGAQGSNFITIGTNYLLTLMHVEVTQAFPLLTLGGPMNGLTLIGNRMNGTNGPAVINSYFIGGGFSLGNLAPDQSTPGVTFDQDPSCFLQMDFAYYNPNRSLGINCTAASPIDVNGDRIRVRNSRTPSSSTDSSGNVGDICWDAGYVYVKTGSGWKRAALESW